LFQKLPSNYDSRVPVVKVPAMSDVREIGISIDYINGCRPFPGVLAGLSLAVGIESGPPFHISIGGSRLFTFAAITVATGKLNIAWVVDATNRQRDDVVKMLV
jgi:hypothetical protein